MSTQTHKKAGRGRFALTENVEQKLIGADGKVKQLFVENKLGQAIIRFFRKINPNSIALTWDEKTSRVVGSHVKPGLLNHLAAYGIKIPGITGNYADSRIFSNLITNAGMAGVASRINGSGGEAAFTYIAVGTGTTAAAASQTALVTELAASGLSRANATASRATTDVTDDTARLVNTFTVTGTAAVTESGVFNASSSGVMLARQVFSAINVVNGDSLQITWNFDVD